MEEQNIPNENVVSPEMEETPPVVKTEKRKRTALCLNCHNEWMAKNGNEKKPTRCPECKSRDVIWRDVEEAGIEDIPDGISDIPQNSKNNSNEIPSYSTEFQEIPENSKTIPKSSTIIPEVSKTIPESSKEFQDGITMENDGIKVEKHGRKVEKPMVELPTTFEEIRDEYEKNAPQFPIPLLIIGVGVAAVVIFLFFRSSKHPQKKVQAAPAKQIQAKPIQAKQIQAKQSVPRRPIPTVLNAHRDGIGTGEFSGSFLNKTALIGGIV